MTTDRLTAIEARLAKLEERCRDDCPSLEEQPPKAILRCPKCGKEGEAHYVPPSMGEPGFYVCDHSDAEQPPELPKQWRHESDPPRKRRLVRGDSVRHYWDSGHVQDLINFTRYEYYPVVPALPRPADQPGKRVTEWGPVKKGDNVILSRGDWLRVSVDFIPDDCGGWRWHYEEVAEKAEVKRWVHTFADDNGFKIDVPMMSKHPSEWPTLDRAAIARDEVVRELEAVLAMFPLTIGHTPPAAIYVQQRLAELKQEDQR